MGIHHEDHLATSRTPPVCARMAVNTCATTWCPRPAKNGRLRRDWMERRHKLCQQPRLQWLLARLVVSRLDGSKCRGMKRSVQVLLPYNTLLLRIFIFPPSQHTYFQYTYIIDFGRPFTQHNQPSRSFQQTHQSSTTTFFTTFQNQINQDALRFDRCFRRPCRCPSMDRDSLRYPSRNCHQLRS